jgi:transcription initiation factor IIE alpha subunit
MVRLAFIRPHITVGFTPFRKDIFIDIVRSLLCAFYDDGEIIVANFLLEGDVAYTDQQIAESLGIPQRQVRSILEARLCKDFIAEAEIPSAGQMGGQTGGAQGMSYGGGSAWYRICPDVLNVAWFRLSLTEKALLEKLKSVQESESYICHRCGGREFDSLRAVSLFNQSDGMFHCDICDDILTVRENKMIREEVEKLLHKFNSKFEPFKARLESLRRMYIPRHIVIKKTVYEKMLETAREQGVPMPGSVGSDQNRFAGFKRDFTQFASALSNLTTQGMTSAGGRVGQAISAPEWIREAQTGGTASEPRSTGVEEIAEIIQSSRVQSGMKKEEIAVKVEAKSTLSESVKSIIESASSGIQPAKKEEPMTGADVTVFVGGIGYPLSEVRDIDNLIERMTDEEFTRYDQLIQRIGFK